MLWKLRAAILAMLALLSTAGWGRADDAVRLRVSSAGAETTRPLAAGGGVVVAALAAQSSSNAVHTVPGSNGDLETVIVELQGAPLVRRAAGGPRRAAQTARGAIDAEHRRVIDEILRLDGGASARRAGTGPVRREFRLVFNGIAATLSADAQRALRTHPDVRGIHRDLPVQAILDSSVAYVRAPTFWAQHGHYRGAGQVIAVVDTGIDYTHADLGACPTVGAGCKVIGGHDFQNDDDDPVDDNGHGTHVAATAAGNGSLLGVAPDASLLAYKVLDASGSGYTSTVIAGIEAAVDPNGDLDTSDHASVINLSLGGAGDPSDPGAVAVDTATAAGVLVVAAAGNSGGYGTIGSPGVARTALTVGAVSEADGAPASFTSGGPTSGTFDLKPEIAAPGVDICAARAAGTELGATCIDATHVVLDGTSMATPHVAGAAALLRGVLPGLSPTEVKSLLAQNGDASPYDALQVGASILDVARAAAAHTVVDPQTLSFGLDDLSASIWSTTRTLTVRNVGAAARSYALVAVDHSWGLPVGSTVTFTPASFTLSPGQSRTVDVALSVDNQIVPNQDYAPSSYEAMLELRSSGETQRVPMIFVKTPVLRIHTDQVATIIYAHDRSNVNNARAAVPTGTTAEMLLPAGTYDIMVLFPVGLGAFVVHEGVVVSGVRDETVDASEAVHTVSLDGQNELGAPLAASMRAVSLLHHASGLGIVTLTSSVYAPFALSFSSIGDAYDVDLALMAQPGAKTYLVHEAVAGVSSSRALANTPAELTRGQFRYYANPGETPTSSLEFLSFMLGSSLGVGLGPPEVTPVDRDLWVTPAPHPGSRVFVQPAILLSGGPDGAHNAPWYRGSTAPGVIQAFNAIDPDDPVYETSTGELPLDLAPASLFAKLTSTDSWIQLRQVAAGWTWTFHSPGGDGPQAPGGTIGYRLLAGGNRVSSGVLPQSGFGGPFLPFLYPLAARPYVLESDPLPYWVGGLAATARFAATFDTRRYPADVDPPYLARVEVRSGGRLAEVAPVGSTPTVLIETHDDLDPAIAVSLTQTVNGVTTPVPVVQAGSGIFTATLTGACDAPGAVDLVLSVADSAGNDLSEWLTPAFACRGATCGNASLEPGEACDDGNLVSGDGCNAVCSSTEVCGDGVVDAGEACDDGNTTDGDCCTVTCQLAAAGSACDDGRFCSGSDTCDALGGCSRHGVKPCSGGAECASFCDETADRCDVAPSGVPCSSDGNVCTGDACDGVGTCAHPPITGPCNDGLFCNGADICAGGTCSAHAGDPCTAGDECADTCQEGSDSCFAFAGTICGDDGEPCTIDVCNGAGACTHEAANAGVVCRAASEPCDVAEECDGLDAACPPDTGVADSDGDALCDGLDPCTNVAGAQDLLSPPAAKLTLGKIFADTAPGNDTITATGSFALPPTTSFAQLMPLGGIGRIALYDGRGAIRVDVALPAGAYSIATRRGWTQAPNGKGWTYRDRSGAPAGGIEKLLLRATSRAADQPGGSVKLTLTGKKGAFPFTDADLPVNLAVTLGDQAAAAAGLCAESAFSNASCAFNGQRNQLKCKR